MVIVAAYAGDAMATKPAATIHAKHRALIVSSSFASATCLDSRLAGGPVPQKPADKPCNSSTQFSRGHIAVIKILIYIGIYRYDTLDTSSDLVSKVYEAKTFVCEASADGDLLSWV